MRQAGLPKVVGSQAWAPSTAKEQEQEQEAKAAEAAKDVKGGGPSPNAAAGAEVDVPKARTEARIQMPPPSSGFLANHRNWPAPLAGRLTPAPKKASKTTAPVFPMP
ncbi:MICAL-like protein 1 [Pteropus alecto]|uniref:MICAL-like protein 1 n=1 Tax=Pteropus alecto TaxID=9402 RepID=L5KW49_PTEAL|nr:MICAL-like protein 1 [Pteropus alecto]